MHKSNSHTVGIMWSNSLWSNSNLSCAYAAETVLPHRDENATGRGYSNSDNHTLQPRSAVQHHRALHYTCVVFFFLILLRTDIDLSHKYLELQWMLTLVHFYLHFTSSVFSRELYCPRFFLDQLKHLHWKWSVYDCMCVLTWYWFLWEEHDWGLRSDMFFSLMSWWKRRCGQVS